MGEEARACFVRENRENEIARNLLLRRAPRGVLSPPVDLARYIDNDELIRRSFRRRFIVRR